MIILICFLSYLFFANIPLCTNSISYQNQKYYKRMVFVWATASYNLRKIFHAVITLTTTSFLSLVYSFR